MHICMIMTQLTWNFAFILVVQLGLVQLSLLSSYSEMAIFQTPSESVLIREDKQLQLRPDFDPSVCVEAGATIKIACIVESLVEHGATIWNGSRQIFNCSSVNTIINDQLFLRHPYFGEMNTHVAHCGDLVSGILFAENDTTFVSVISITTMSHMNGGYVSCTDQKSRTNEQIQLIVTDPPLAPFLEEEVEFNNESFSVEWTAEENNGHEVYFHVETTNQCGDCTMEQTSILCAGWTVTQDGQVCNVTVTAVINTSACYLESRHSLIVLILFKSPAQPEFLTVVPIYSIDENNLMQVNSTILLCNQDNLNFTENIWPVTYYGLLLDDVKLVEGRCLRRTVNHTIANDLQDNFPQEPSKQYSLTAYANNSFGEVETNYSNNIELKNPYLTVMNITSTDKVMPPMLRISLKVDASVSIMYGPEPNCSALTYPVKNDFFDIDFTIDSPSANYSGNVCCIITAQYNVQKIEVHHSFFYDYSRNSSRNKSRPTMNYMLLLAIVIALNYN